LGAGSEKKPRHPYHRSHVNDMHISPFKDTAQDLAISMRYGINYLKSRSFISAFRPICMTLSTKLHGFNTFVFRCKLEINLYLKEIHLSSCPIEKGAFYEEYREEHERE
jgi:hypothetical protein